MSYAAMLLAAMAVAGGDCQGKVKMTDDQGKTVATFLFQKGVAGIQWPHSDGIVLLEGSQADSAAGKIVAPLMIGMVMAFDRDACAGDKTWTGTQTAADDTVFQCRRVTGTVTRAFPDAAFEVSGADAKTGKALPQILLFDASEDFLGLRFAKDAPKINGKTPKVWTVGNGPVTVKAMAAAVEGKCE